MVCYVKDRIEGNLHVERRDGKWPIVREYSDLGSIYLLIEMSE